MMPDSVCDPHTILLHGVLSDFRCRAMRQLKIIAPRHQLGVLRRSSEAGRWSAQNTRISVPDGIYRRDIVRRRMPDDWAERYNTAPVLIETFVETPRHTGAVYQDIGLDPCRNHPGPGTKRPPHETRPAEKGHLASHPQKKLEANPQPVSPRRHRRVRDDCLSYLGSLPAAEAAGRNRSLRPWGAAIGETVNVQRGRRSAGCAHRPHPSTGRFHGLNERLPPDSAARPNPYQIPAQGCARLGNKTVPIWYLDENRVCATKENPS